MLAIFSKEDSQSFFSALFELLFKSRSFGSKNSKTDCKAKCLDESHYEETILEVINNKEPELTSNFWIKPEYAVLVPNYKTLNQPLNVMGNILSIQISENESMSSIKGMLDEAIMGTNNIAPKEASSIISSSMPQGIIQSGEIHAICNQIKSLAAKYRFEPSRFENFISK